MKLEGAEREKAIEQLNTAGWSLVEGRDAIQKEFKFKNFNRVSSLFLMFLLKNEIMNDEDGEFYVS